MQTLIKLRCQLEDADIDKIKIYYVGIDMGM